MHLLLIVLIKFLFLQQVDAKSILKLEHNTTVTSSIGFRHTTSIPEKTEQQIPTIKIKGFSNPTKQIGVLVLSIKSFVSPIFNSKFISKVYLFLQLRL